MNKTELIQALAARGTEDAEAVLDAVADIIWHALERGEEVDWPRVGRFIPEPAPRRRKVVTFVPASEFDVAVNRHHVEA
jgi:nucleoid DNA-binding protein